MTLLDWLVLFATTAFIVIWGLQKRQQKAATAASYLKGDQSLSWPTIGLSVMATQASAITFLSVPGQAYDDGMRFVQFYFAVPIAMIIVSSVFIPIYYKMKVYTAYEYLEGRFDLKVRLFAALMFLISRGLAAGITIYAPAILLSAILGWDLNLTCVGIGLVVIFYTVLGGSEAVSQTQRQQMLIIFMGLFVAAFSALYALPEDVSLGEAVRVAGATGKINPITFDFDFNDRYNIWSGLLGGLFLSVAYFGTDQSQVGRYLGGKSLSEIRLGLLFNGVFKIPMQAFILFLGILVYCVYVFSSPPAFWNQSTLLEARQEAPELMATLESGWEEAVREREDAARLYIASGAKPGPEKASLQEAEKRMKEIQANIRAEIQTALPHAQMEDRDFIFLEFALKYMPKGLLGLLIAVILAAAMSSTASELQSLGATTTVDFHQTLSKKKAGDKKTITIGRLYTIMWGGFAIAFATYASLLDNLIQAVNILGSLFYGAVLGIFLTAFFLKRVQAKAMLSAAILGEAMVITLYFTSDVAYLWLNLIGCAAVCLLALIFQGLYKGQGKAKLIA